MTTTTTANLKQKPMALVNGCWATVEPGCTIQLDGWVAHGRLQEGDAPVDGAFPGCQFRVDVGREVGIPVNVVLTGRVARFDAPIPGSMRCRVEIVHDGEPSEFVNGWVAVQLS